MRQKLIARASVPLKVLSLLFPSQKWFYIYHFIIYIDIFFGLEP